MGRKDPPQQLPAPLAGSNHAIDNGPQSSHSLRSPTQEVAVHSWGISARSNENMRQAASRTGELSRPEMNSRSVSNDGGIPLDAGIQNSPVKGGFFGFNRKKDKASKKEKEDSKRPSTAKDGGYRDENDHLSSRMTDMNIDDDRSHSRDGRPSTAGRTLKDNKSEPMLNKHMTMHIAPESAKLKKEKHGFLGRKNSKREEDEDSANDSIGQRNAGGLPEQSERGRAAHFDEAPRTAPIHDAREANFDDSHNVRRNRSAERHPLREANAGNRNAKAKEKESSRHNRAQPSMAIPRSKQNIFGNIKGAVSKGAKGMFNGHNANKAQGSAKAAGAFVSDEMYNTKVLHLPLIEQTRISRISKQLETSRDKTEYWMPAIAWRLIDYLNYRGTEQEGLYRVSASTNEINRYWQRFDQELDVDLFAEANLYDINTVGALLKKWCRELPDPVFPSDVAERVLEYINAENAVLEADALAEAEAREAAGLPEEVADGSDDTPAVKRPVPTILIEELSNLPPYNYYLLFALTCHLSLVVEHREKNKMSFQNLLVCFRPSMRIDATIFRYLVLQWRECWVGCASEKKWMKEEEEYKLSQLAPLPDEMGLPDFGPGAGVGSGLGFAGAGFGAVPGAGVLAQGHGQGHGHARQASAHSGTTLASSREHGSQRELGGQRERERRPSTVSDNPSQSSSRIDLNAADPAYFNANYPNAVARERGRDRDRDRDQHRGDLVPSFPSVGASLASFASSPSSGAGGGGGGGDMLPPIRSVGAMNMPSN